jgi:phage baseplate assembly protein W
MHFEFVRTPGAVAALTADAKRMWEAAMTMEDVDKAKLFNGTSVISHVAMMDDFADQRRWNGDVMRLNEPAPPLALPIVAAVREIRSGVKTLVDRPAPGPVGAIDYEQLAVALVPHLRQAIKDVLAGATIETDIIIPEATP